MVREGGTEKGRKEREARGNRGGDGRGKGINEKKRVKG